MARFFKEEIHLAEIPKECLLKQPKIFLERLLFGTPLNHLLHRREIARSFSKCFVEKPPYPATAPLKDA